MGPPENLELDDGMLGNCILRSLIDTTNFKLGFWFVHPSKEIKAESWDLSHSKAELLRIVIELSGDAATRRYESFMKELCLLLTYYRFLYDIVSRAERLLHLGLFYRGSIPTKWHQGRVVLLGDAPHAMLPYLGQVCSVSLRKESKSYRLN